MGKGNRGVLEGQSVELFSRETTAYLREIQSTLDLEIRTVALDCPSAPMAEGLQRRAAERAMDARRVSCFATPSEAEFDAICAKGREHLASGGAENRLPHANQLWMLAGFALFERLSKEYECREVFPQAIVSALGVSKKHKSKKEGLALQVRAAADACGLSSHELRRALATSSYGSAHDRLDAYLSAWVASLPEEELEACGRTPGDVIWLPKGLLHSC